MPPTRKRGRNRNNDCNRGRRNFGRPNYGRQQNNNNSNNSNRRFDFATPIAVATDFSITDLPTVQVQGPNGKFTCYVSSAESKESFLHCLMTYQSAIVTAGIENNRQRIAGLRNILDPSLTHHYDSSLATLNINLLGNALVTALKNAVFSEFDRSALCEYLSRGQLSTANLQPQAFYQRLQALKTYAASMPGNAAVPNDETLRLTFFNAMPHAAKEQFGEMHGLPGNMATPELIRFMERQMRYSSRPSSSNSNGNGNHGNGNNNNYGNNNNGNHGNRRNDSDWNRHGNQSRRDQCPLHPGASHSFSECFANPRSAKYDADFAAHLHARSTQRGDRPSSSGSRPDTHRGPGKFARNNRSAPNAHITQTDGPPDSVPATNAHMNRGTIPFDESLTLDPLPCHAGAAGPSTVDDGPFEGEPLARSAVHHFDQIGPSLQAPSSIDHDVDDNDSVTIEAFAEAFLNDDSQSVSSSQFDLTSRPILDDSPPLSVPSPTHPYCPTTVAIARSIQKQPSFKPLVSLIDSGSTYSHVSVHSPVWSYANRPRASHPRLYSRRNHRVLRRRLPSQR
jgi:hypothetical protein